MNVLLSKLDEAIDDMENGMFRHWMKHGKKLTDYKEYDKMNIELRVPTSADKTGLKAVCNAIDRTYLSDRLPYPYTDESADWWMNMISENEGKSGVWRVIYVDGRLAGTISVEQKSDVFRKDAEIGYMLSTEYWSQGIATEAVKQICKIAFETLDIIRITGMYYEPNVASKRVLEKAGFEQEGIMRNAVVKGDKVYDLCVTGLLKEIFMARSAYEKDCWNRASGF